MGWNRTFEEAETEYKRLSRDTPDQHIVIWKHGLDHGGCKIVHVQPSQYHWIIRSNHPELLPDGHPIKTISCNSAGENKGTNNMIVEVAFVRKPTVKEQETGRKEELILGFQSVTADNKDSAIAAVAVANADKLKENINELTVVTRSTGT